MKAFGRQVQVALNSEVRTKLALPRAREGEETVDLLDKLKVINKLAATKNALLVKCAAIGDSIYNVPLFKKVKLSIAFNTDESN